MKRRRVPTKYDFDPVFYLWIINITHTYLVYKTSWYPTHVWSLEVDHSCKKESFESICQCDSSSESNLADKHLLETYWEPSEPMVQNVSVWKLQRNFHSVRITSGFLLIHAIPWYREVESYYNKVKAFCLFFFAPVREQSAVFLSNSGIHEKVISHS